MVRSWNYTCSAVTLNIVLFKDNRNAALSSEFKGPYGIEKPNILSLS